MKRQMLRLTLSICALSVLAGCEWFGGKKGSSESKSASSTGEPLICFGTKTILTVEEFQKKLKMLQESQPGLEGMIASLAEPEQLGVYQRFAEGCVAEGLIKEYVKEKGLDATAEFKEMARQAHEALEGQLSLQAFQNDVIKEVEAAVDKMTEADLRAYYEQRREKDAIFQRDPFLKNKEKKLYASFEEVREPVKSVIKQERLGNIYQSKLEELKKQYGVKVENACLTRFVVKKEGPNNAAQASETPEAAQQQRSSSANAA